MGASRIGGTADLPVGVSWPQYRSRPMEFFGQIDLGDLPAGASPLPSSGLLSFFAAADFDIYGAQPLGVGALLYNPTQTPLRPCPPPFDVELYRACHVELLPGHALPDPSPDEFDGS